MIRHNNALLPSDPQCWVVNSINLKVLTFTRDRIEEKNKLYSVRHRGRLQISTVFFSFFSSFSQFQRWQEMSRNGFLLGQNESLVSVKSSRPARFFNFKKKKNTKKKISAALHVKAYLPLKSLPFILVQNDGSTN